jgi:hypothetical protein
MNFLPFRSVLCVCQSISVVATSYSVALVRPLIVCEASANFCGLRVPRGQRDIPTAVFSDFLTEPVV